MSNCRRYYSIPEVKVQQVPYTVCKLVPEERTEVIRCRRCKLVPEQHSCQIPYMTCRLVPEEKVTVVPNTVCTLQPYCVNYKVCRQVPVCLPVGEPPCPPAVPLSSRVGSTEWYARLTDKALHVANAVSAAADSQK
jgi:hypothetical protein